MTTFTIADAFRSTLRLHLRYRYLLWMMILLPFFGAIFMSSTYHIPYWIGFVVAYGSAGIAIIWASLSEWWEKRSNANP